MSKPHILMVEDSAPLALIYRTYLEDAGYAVQTAGTLAAAREALADRLPELVLLDIELPDGSGMAFLDELRVEAHPVEVIVMTVHGSSELALGAIRAGAFDFLTKPFDSARLLVTVENALSHQALNERVDALAKLEREGYSDFIGTSAVMQAVYQVIDSAAPSKATVFVIGESGTGKELAAEAIHKMSDRREGPFLALNCGAIPGELIESELFGHVRGAFTGATAARDGAASVADGGTLFLDEICEMDLELQKKLLRFIQTGTFQRVGSNRTESVDIRFVCATNRDPLDEVRAGRFREDLYYRLHVVPLDLPPLRRRGDDAVRIARAFLAEFSERYGKGFKAFDAAVEATFLAHDWPGNVRELRNLIERLVVLNSGELITSAMLPPLGDGAVGEPAAGERVASGGAAASASEAAVAPTGTAAVKPLWRVEKEAIEAAIEACDGSVNRAAGLLEVAPSTIYRKLQSWQEA